MMRYPPGAQRQVARGPHAAKGRQGWNPPPWRVPLIPYSSSSQFSTHGPLLSGLCLLTQGQSLQSVYAYLLCELPEARWGLHLWKENGTLQL